MSRRPSPGSVIFIARVFTAGLVLPAASCTAIKHSGRATVRPVGAALDDTYRAWQNLPAGRPDTSGERIQWRASLGGLLQSLEHHAPPRTWTGTQSIQGWTVTFKGDSNALLAIQPSTCGKITPVDPSKSLRKLERRVSGDGVGLPVVMVQPRSPHGPDPFFPPNGRHLPATLTAEFSGERKVTLTFHHTRNVQKARVRGAVRPLAFDLSQAVAGSMDSRFLSKYAFMGLIRPDKHLREAGIYTPEPYDPKKMPLVLVHGLDSAPHIWANAINSVAADPVLRQNFQSWYFLYPTGLTIQAAAATLRKSLKDARDFYDPKHQSAAMQRTVMAGHSMGGLLTQMQVIDSGDRVYRAFFTVPFEKLPLSRSNLSTVKESLFFDHLPFVKRAIFIATPHKGSKLANLSVWRLLKHVIQPAKILSGLLKEVSSVARFAINPRLSRFRELGTGTAEGLSPEHPLLPAINDCPIRVPYHNIIPVFQPFGGAPKPVEGSSDGVVLYSSSFLPGAESTATVKGFHTCANSIAVADEIDRILRVHAARHKRSAAPAISD